MRRLATWLALGLGMTAATAAAAHTPYLAPTTFAPSRDYVTVEAALAETGFFIPDFPIRGAGDYLVIGPDGVSAKATSVTALKEFVAVEAALPAPGTYRITTGDRGGRSGKWAKVEGRWRAVRPAGAPARAARPGDDEAPADGPIDEDRLPAGAEVVTAQSFIKAETYVSRGSPTRGPLKPVGQGLEIAPETHPNEIYAGEAFKFALMNDGQPAAGASFIVSRAGDLYAEKKYAHEGKTGADGKAAVTFAEPGVYVLETRYPGRVEGAAPPARATTYTLTFEVTR